jgi:nicotinamide-nucleotide amidase
LTGKICDTNSQWVASQLFASGLRLERSTVIPDEVETIIQTVRACAGSADIVICFGGLGPTSDDRTAEAIAALLGEKLITHEPTQERLLEFCRARNREVTPQNLKQTIYPKGTQPIDNTVGLAVGFTAAIGRSQISFLPGVPAEMKAMFQSALLPGIVRRLGSGTRLRHHLWRCLGVPESELQRAMVPIESALPKQAWLGYRTRFPENHLTLYWRSEGAADDAQFEARQREIRQIVTPWAYTEEDKELEQLVLDGLSRRSWRIAFAESCTGGLAAQRLTRIPGASAFVWGGFHCYQTEAKRAMLGVDVSPEAAVSAGCTRELARAALRVSGVDLAAAITGYAGPGGGTDADPVGTLYLCVVGKTIQEHRLRILTRDREQNQWGAATHLLNAIRVYLNG